jgi:hypothetical protein
VAATTLSEELLERIRQCAMPEGPVECQGTWLRQKGEMRLAPGRPWVRFHAEEWFPGSGIDFHWKAWMRVLRVVDAFESGRGTLIASLFGVVPVARSTGPATDKGEALRGLAELPWRPFAFRSASHLFWDAVTAHQLRVTFDDGRTHAMAHFDIDDHGHVLGGSARSRPRLAGKKLVETPWFGIYGDYRQFGNLRVPTVAEVSWQFPEGPFTYWRGRVTEFRILK